MYTQSKQEQGAHLMEFLYSFSLSHHCKAEEEKLGPPSVDRGGKQGMQDTNSDVTYFTFHFLALSPFPTNTSRYLLEGRRKVNNTGKTGAPQPQPGCFRALTGRERKKKKRYMFCTIKHVCTLTHKYLYLHTYIHSNSMNIDFR